MICKLTNTRDLSIIH